MKMTTLQVWCETKLVQIYLHTILQMPWNESKRGKKKGKKGKKDKKDKKVGSKVNQDKREIDDHSDDNNAEMLMADQI